MLLPQCYSTCYIAEQQFRRLCRNNMWKWLVNGCAVLYPPKLCVLILLGKGAWPGLRLGKLFPLQSGQRQTFLVPWGLFGNHSCGIGKPSSTPGARLLVTPWSQALEGAQIKIYFISTPSLPQYDSQIFGTICRPLLSWEGFSFCDSSPLDETP